MSHGLALSFSPTKKAKPGGANRDRTGDLLLAKQALSQLSYGPGNSGRTVGLVGLGGLEPPTPRLSSVCSNQLSYRPCLCNFVAGKLNAQPIGVGARTRGFL